MENEILKGVVEVEKDIRQRLEIERKKVQEWLAKVKHDVEKEVLEEEAGLKENLNRSVHDAHSDAQVKAARIINDAEEYARKLESLGDDVLKRVALRHVHLILPGE
jgi:hypothetical protein